MRTKYHSDPTVDVSRIELVDFVWNSGNLDVAVPVEYHGTFDACIDHLLTTLDETESAPYVDCHAWCYTPFSFKLVMLELNVFELVNWVIDVDFPADGGEFIVVLKKGRMAFPSASALQEARKTLLQGILADVAAQYDYPHT